ncbi:hypothetical protein H0H93_010050 [Arthromyces matolae]|nr:hypothetical protein H0H93_010050 [Arthromyces matolae]
MAGTTLKLHSPLDSIAHRQTRRKPELAPERPIPNNPQDSPVSPLLHSHFARHSAATASTSTDDNSFIHSARTSIDSRIVYNNPAAHDARYIDHESISSYHDSWQLAPTSDTARMYQATPVPTVVVSSPLLDLDVTRAGRTPVVRPITSNFSRPVRPPLTLESEQQKRKVLERNTTCRLESQNDQTLGTSVTKNAIDITSKPTSKDRQKKPSPLSSNSSQPFAQRALSALQPVTGHSQGEPSRSVSPASSLYSNYSYYQLPPSAGASPPLQYECLDAPLDPSAFTTQPRTAPKPPLTRSVPSSAPTLSSGTSNPTNTQRQVVVAGETPPSHKPQDYLQLGITHHEANRLKESAACFEKSAKEGGGCGVGMLMWGLTLRHGWGCDKNEKVGFKWLQRAAESAVDDLENARTRDGLNLTAIQTELVLAIYEVGQCFFQGWGVAKDQKMAVSYYTVAARLGDPDAQSDLAFCLANGKGCKKDRKEAAKWYRAAVAQGASDIGLAWIYKEKFQ